MTLLMIDHLILHKQTKLWQSKRDAHRLSLIHIFIADVYKVSLPVSQPVRNTPVSQSAPQSVNRPTSSIMGTEDPHKTILNEASSINRILRNNKDENSGKRIWMNEDIDRIRRHAQRIVDACNRL